MSLQRAAEQRAHHLSRVSGPIEGLYLDILSQVDVSDVDYDEIALRSPEADEHGPSLLYAAGLVIWKAARDVLPNINLTTHFNDQQLLDLETYSFNRSISRIANSFMQSAMSAPTTFACWWGEAANLTERAGPRRQWGKGVTADMATTMLGSDWFVDILREGSLTNSGFYRNSTGFELSYESYITRSGLRPLEQFEAATGGGESIVDVDDMTAPLSGGKLSRAFVGYLHQRMRDHNADVRDGTAELGGPFDGTSRGCPIAHNAQRAVDASTDVYVATCKMLASVVEQARS